MLSQHKQSCKNFAQIKYSKIDKIMFLICEYLIKE